jgi:hypothetical protein
MFLIGLLGCGGDGLVTVISSALDGLFVEYSNRAGDQRAACVWWSSSHQTTKTKSTIPAAAPPPPPGRGTGGLDAGCCGGRCLKRNQRRRSAKHKAG